MTPVTFGPIDPFVFYRGFEPNSAVASAARHLSAAATRLCFSILFGMLVLPDSVWEQAKGLLDARTLWGLCLVVAAWLIATMIGGPVGLAIDGLIIAYGLYELWPVVKQIAGDGWEWLRGAYYANTETDLKLAGQHFGDALAGGLLTILQTIVLHRVFKRVSKTMVEHIPVPEWLERHRETVETQRRQARESTPLERAASSVAARVMVPAGKGVGREFPTALAVVGGVAVAAGVATVVLLANAGSKQ